LIAGETLASFKGEFNQGMELMKLRRRELKAPVLYCFLDWILCLFTLYFAFLAVHYFIHPEVLVVGFAVGLFASILSLIPGGLGVMEGSMAAIYYSLEVPLEEGHRRRHPVSPHLLRISIPHEPPSLSIALQGGQGFRETVVPGEKG